MLLTLLAVSSTAWIIGGIALGLILVGGGVYYFKFYNK